MGNPKKDFGDTNNDAPKSILIVPIAPEHIGELMGFDPQGHTGERYLKDKHYFESYIGTGLVAMEPRSASHPQGRAVGYALIGKNPSFKKSLCLNNFFVLADEPRREEYTEQLVRSTARVFMAKGHTKMEVMVADGYDALSAICLGHGGVKEARHNGLDADIYTISDLSGKFSYGAEKKAAELKP